MKTFIIEDKQRIESIILHCDACFVGITDLEGNPYVCLLYTSDAADE